MNYRHTLLYCTLLYCTSQFFFKLWLNFIIIFVLLWWSGTEAVSPRYSCTEIKLKKKYWDYFGQWDINRGLLGGFLWNICVIREKQEHNLMANPFPLLSGQSFDAWSCSSYAIGIRKQTWGLKIPHNKDDRAERWKKICVCNDISDSWNMPVLDPLPLDLLLTK